MPTSRLGGQNRCNLRLRQQRHDQDSARCVLDDLLGNTSQQEVAKPMPPVTAHDDKSCADANGMFDNSGMRTTRLGRRGARDVLFSHLGHGTIQLFRGMAQHFRHRHRHGDDIAGGRHDQRRVQVDVEDFKSRVKGSRQRHSGIESA